MNVDPSGHSAILIGLLIGIGLGAAFGAGTATYTAVKEGETGWDLAWDIVGGTLLGGAAGLASVGMSVGGYGLSLGASAAISIGTVTAANMVSYSLDCASSSNKWNQKDFFMAGAEGTLHGVINFGVGFIGGRIGLFNGLDKVIFHSYFQQNGMNGIRFGVYASQTFIGEIASKFMFVTIPSMILRTIFNI